MKYAVIGAGAMGSVLGAGLALGGGEVWFVDPFAAHMQAINEKGLDFDFNGTPHNIKNIKAVTSAKDVGCKMDLILLMVKGIFTTSALENIRILADENTIILSLQNGIGNIDLLMEGGFPVEQLAHGVVDFGATLKAPGSVLCQIKPGQGLHFSPVDHKPKATLQEAADCWVRGGHIVELVENIEYKIWYKFAMNCGGNAQCALVRTNLGEYLDHPMGKQFCLNIQQEIVNVANAKGIPLDMAKFVAAREKPLGPLGGHMPSTSQDMIAKKATEVEFLYGAVCREGKKHGIPTPFNEAMYLLTKVYEDTYSSKHK